MMQQEKYGIQLELITTKFKEQVNNLKGTLTRFKQEAKETSTIDFDARTELLKRKIEDMKQDLKTIDTSTTVGKGDFLRLASDIQKSEKQLERLNSTEEETKSKFSGLGTVISNEMKKGEKNVKKFAFSLLSVRGIFGMIRKASSSYMAQDQQLADQMQKTWASLGALLAPIIEKVVQAIRTAAAYINYFVKILTGKDLIAQATKKINNYNKGLNATAKSAKSATKELTSLDEITNLSMDSGEGTDSGIASGVENVASAFDDFSDIKLDENITKALQNIAKVFKSVFGEIKKVVDYWYKNTVKKIVDGTKEMKQGMKDATTSQTNLTKSVKETITTGQKQVKQMTTITKGAKSYNDTLLNGNGNIKSQIEAVRGQYNTWTKLTGAYKEADKQLQAIVEREKNNTKALTENYKQGKLTVEQSQEYKKMLKEQIDYYTTLASKTKAGTVENELYNSRIKDLTKTLKEVNGTKYSVSMNVATEEAKTKVNSFVDSIKSFTKNNFKTFLEVGVKTSDAKTKLSTFFSGVNNFANSVKSLFGGLFKGTTSSISSLISKFIPSFDVGTNYIPHDTLAQVHKGEMIVPAKYNPATSNIGTGNYETNSLLIELNKNILELSKKPTVLSVNGKELAQATYKDYQNEGNRLNTSTSISIR